MTAIWTGLTTSSPVSLAPTSEGKVLGVNGRGRGFVVAGGTTAYSLGITAPPPVAASVVKSPAFYYVSGVEMVEGGENYYAPPSVTITGVSGARAFLVGDAVASITITSSATTHTAAPAVNIGGNQANDAAAYATVRGGVIGVNVGGHVAVYSEPPAVTFSATTGVSQLRAAAGRAVLIRNYAGITPGSVTSVVIEDPGVYEWGALGIGVSPVNATVTGAVSLFPVVSGAVHAITISNSGSKYTSPPAVVLLPNSNFREGSGAAAVANLNGTTQVQSIEILSGGNGYAGGVTVQLRSQPASATAVMQPRLAGKYLVGWRFVASDGTVGNLCPLQVLDCGEQASSISWNLNSISLADGTPNRIERIELWRTTADQAITLYRVASLTAANIAALPGKVFLEGMVDSELADPERSTVINGAASVYQELPILTGDGLPNAYRFGIPPSTMSVVTLYGDRAWYAVDTSGNEPNTLYFSGVQEYEGVASENQLVLQNTGRESDVITGLMPMGGVLYVGQRRTLVRVTVGEQPLLSASAVPVAQRGMLTDRCWDQFEGVAYIADSMGVYAFDGSQADPISDPVATYWTAQAIDFSKSTWFFVRVDPSERVVRFYFCLVEESGDYPDRALCYSITTKAWWLEKYAVAVSCGVRALRQGRVAELLGANNRLMQANSGLTDDGAPIQYVMRTGALPLNGDPKRGVRLLYSPTSSSHNIQARLYYNNDVTPRPNAIASDRGTGFTTTTGSTQATLDMAAARSPLGTASGVAQFSLSGRLDDRSVGADRHVAVELAGEQSTTRAVIHRMEVEGAG